jgi:hypothetical protein
MRLRWGRHRQRLEAVALAMSAAPHRSGDAIPLCDETRLLADHADRTGDEVLSRGVL